MINKKFLLKSLILLTILLIGIVYFTSKRPIISETVIETNVPSNVGVSVKGDQDASGIIRDNGNNSKTYSNDEYRFEFEYPSNYKPSFPSNIPPNHDLVIDLGLYDGSSESIFITLQRVTQPYGWANEEGWVSTGYKIEENFVVDGEPGRFVEVCGSGGCTKRVQVIHKGVVFDISMFAVYDNASEKVKDIAKTIKFH